MSPHEFRIEIVGDGGGPNGGPAPADSVRQPATVPPPRPAWLPTANPQSPRPPRQPARSPFVALAIQAARAFNLRTISAALTRYEQVQKTVQGIGKELQKNAKFRAARAARVSRTARPKVQAGTGLSPAEELRRLMSGGIRSTLMQDIRANVGQLMQDIRQSRAGQFVGRAVQRVLPARAAAARPARPVASAASNAGPGLLTRAGQFAAQNPAQVAMAAGAVAATAVAVGGAVMAVRSFTRSLNDAARRFELLAPRTAMASAQAEVAQIRGDIGRARQLDDDLARFIRVQSQISQHLQDARADLQEIGLKFLTPIAQGVAVLARIASGMTDLSTKGFNTILEMLRQMVASSEAASKLLDDIINILQDLVENEVPDHIANEPIDDFLNMHGPADGPPGPLPGGLFPPGPMGGVGPGGLPAGWKGGG